MIFFRMRKAEKFLHESWRQFRRNASKLSPETKEQILSVMRGLQTSLLQKDRTMAKVHTAELRSLFRLHLKKRPLTAFWDYNVSLLVALVVVIIIRQSCFEPYEIPSGSMRPTFKEKDRLVVSKTQFGLNIPLIPSHFIFDPSEVKRMGVFTFTGEGMDIPNVKTTYFYLFPGYKQYVKRMIGLPGDSIYFYGGKLYGIDKHGNDISHELQRKELSHLEHIPFIQLEGRAYPAQPKGELFSSVTIKQMNMPIAKLYVSPNKSVHYELLKKGDVHELFGMGNFAASRIIMKEDKPYLELTHHASAQKAKLGRDPFYRMRPILHTETSLIPLSEEHLHTIWDHLYTGRFVVKNGLMYRYGMSSKEAAKHPYHLKVTAPDGMYEFYQGDLYSVGSQGNLSLLEKTHPLALFSLETTIQLYNAGIECDTRFLKGPIPSSRYAYFRDGDLYLMGAPILKKDDPTLIQFVQSEQEKAAASRYTPFIDLGPPTKEMIVQWGITIPEKHYLALGDNHAMSSDCRDFGFIPEDNIRGTPSFLFWAPGGRFGDPNHGIYPFATVPRGISWSLLLAAYALYRYRSRKRLKAIASLGSV